MTLLGLTQCQAKVYLALINEGVSSVKTISEKSQVPREKVYLTIASLQKAGLIEKILASPSKFKAIPIKDCIPIFLNKKHDEYIKLRKKALRLLQNHQSIEHNINTCDEAQFIIIPPKNANIQKRKKAINALEKNLDCITTYGTFIQMVETLGEEMIKALDRGVRLRFIMNMPTCRKISKIDEKFSEHPLLQLKYTSNPPIALTALFDEKQAYLVTSPEKALVDSPILWSNHPSFVSIIHDYFELAWTNANAYNYDNVINNGKSKPKKTIAFPATMFSTISK